MDRKISEEQAASQPENSLGIPASAETPKKKASWFRTILWIVSMMALFNIVAGILVYIFMPPVK
jgi:hypothetical protein